MGIRVERRRNDGVVEVWLVNSSPHPESIHYEGETYVLGTRSEALIGTEPAPPEEPTPEEPAPPEEPTTEEPAPPEEPTTEEPAPEGASTEGKSGGRRRGSKR